MEQASSEMRRLLLERLVAEVSDAHQKSRSDRHRLHALEWEGGVDCPSILGEVEVRCDTVVGLVQMYLRVGFKKFGSDETNDMLRRSSIYHSHVLLEWLLEAGSDYDAFASYLHRIEHLRMFLGEIVAARAGKIRNNEDRREGELGIN